MTNPILQMISSTSNPQPTQSGNNPLARLAEIKKLLSGQAPQVLFNQMLQTNPAFADFVRRNKDKSPEQIAQDCGIDLAALQDLLR